jgi:transketolase
MIKENNWLRRKALESIYYAKSGHPGGVLSAIDIIDFLFKSEMDYSIDDFESLTRDRFILSKGHSAPALYAVGAKVGIISKDRLNGLRKINHELQAHTHRLSTPWVEASTGSLGQGFSFAIGEAKAMKMQSIDNRVYVMLGDGELQEGEVWEGAMFSAHHELDNLCAIVDYNKMQSDNLNENIIRLEPLVNKWKSFGWNVIEIDGHKSSEIKYAFDGARNVKTKPTIIIANTIKGKGVSFMENSPTWHGSVKMTKADLKQALLELGSSNSEIGAIINE